MLDGLATGYLVDTVSLERRTAVDAYRGDTYAAAITTRGRWHDEVRLVLGPDAKQLTSNAHVSLQVPVSAGDRVTDPSGRVRQVVAVRKNANLAGGTSHWVAYVA